MATITVKSYELKRNNIVQCTGSVRICAEFAATELHRKDKSLTDAQLDGLERDLRKTKQAILGAYSFCIDPIIEEYEEDEEE